MQRSPNYMLKKLKFILLKWFESILLESSFEHGNYYVQMARRWKPKEFIKLKLMAQKLLKQEVDFSSGIEAPESRIKTSTFGGCLIWMSVSLSRLHNEILKHKMMVLGRKAFGDNEAGYGDKVHMDGISILIKETKKRALHPFHSVKPQPEGSD